MDASSTFAGAIEIALNHYLSLNPDAQTQLLALQHKIVAIELADLGLTFYCMIGKHNICVQNRVPEHTDTLIRGSLAALFQLGISHDPNSLFSGKVTIEGDVELGQQFQALLASENIDWEEQLSHLAGDIAAHRIGRAARQANTWRKRSGHSLEEDIRDYLQEESRLLPHPLEAEQFSSDVDILRNDCARLEARIQRCLSIQEPIQQPIQKSTKASAQEEQTS